MIVEESTEPAETGQLLTLIQLMPLRDAAQSSKCSYYLTKDRLKSVNYKHFKTFIGKTKHTSQHSVKR